MNRSLNDDAVARWCERNDLHMSDFEAWNNSGFTDPPPLRRSEKSRCAWMARSPASNASVDSWHRWLIDGGYSPLRASGMLAHMEGHREQEARARGERSRVMEAPDDIFDAFLSDENSPHDSAPQREWEEWGARVGIPVERIRSWRVISPPQGKSGQIAAGGARSVHRGVALQKPPLLFKRLHEIATAPPAKWLVHAWFPEHGTGVLYGPPNVGKSFAVLNLAMCVALGKPWYGKRCSQKGVMYVAAEGGGAFGERVQASATHHDVMLHDQTLPFGMAPETVDLRNAGNSDGDRVIAACKLLEEQTGHEVGLVVIDTLSRALAGGDENTASDVGLVLTAAQRIADALKCFVLLVHHPGKDVDRGPRGSAIISGNVDTIVKVKPNGRGGRLELDKQRDGPNGLAVEYVIEAVRFGQGEHGEPLSSAVAVEVREPLPIEFQQDDEIEECGTGAAPKPKITQRWQKHVLRTLSKLIADGVEAPLRDDLLAAYQSQAAASGEALGENWRKQFRRALNDLVRMQVLRHEVSVGEEQYRLADHSWIKELFAGLGMELRNSP
jgi:hypothetical protein